MPPMMVVASLVMRPIFQVNCVSVTEIKSFGRAAINVEAGAHGKSLGKAATKNSVAPMSAVGPHGDEFVLAEVFFLR